MSVQAVARSGRAIQVLQVSAELFPWVKTGGLADVTGSLPGALSNFGVELRPVLPGFPAFTRAVTESRALMAIKTPWGDDLQIKCVRFASNAFGWAYLIVAPHLYERGGSPYETADRQAFGDNHRRFAALSWGAKALAYGLDPTWEVSLVHAHDWHAGLTALYLKFHHAPHLKSTPCLFTIHNLAYQGLFASKHLHELAIPEACWHLDGVEFYGQISMLKAGIAYADQISTVSPRYASEIQQAAQGLGLHGFLSLHSARLSGILNGIDTQIWDPAHDPMIAKRYSLISLDDKKENVRALTSILGLDNVPRGPRCAVISRLTEQKGLGLIVQAAPTMIQDGAQLVVLGNGEPAIERQFEALQAKYPGKVSFRADFDERLAHQMIAGSDLILVPSRFEPCGLTQLYGMRYGCLPLVHLVGGLADTVRPWRLSNETVLTKTVNQANGFGFSEHCIESFVTCWQEMMACWTLKPVWEKLQSRGMSLALGWDVAAENYAALYDRMLFRDAHRP